jgi:hypothetical protein
MEGMAEGMASGALVTSALDDVGVLVLALNGPERS